ncbi:MAG: hypothetical protein K2N64_01035 [Anaeroplasmataceae bacterium]|nr:hypothetical protein [Anaeroplasmataceae bacterium]
MKSLKKSTILRKLAIYFSLGGVALAGAITPVIMNAYKTPVEEEKTPVATPAEYTMLAVENDFDYLEYGIQNRDNLFETFLKPHLTVTASYFEIVEGDSVKIDHVLPKEAYSIQEVTYFKGEEPISLSSSFEAGLTAVITVQLGELTATTQVDKVYKEDLQSIDISIDEQKSILQDGIYKLRDGKKQLDLLGNEVLKDGNPIYTDTTFLTTRSNDELLDYLTITLNYSRFSLSAMITESPMALGDVYSYAIRQASFSEGMQTITVEVGCVGDEDFVVYRTSSENVVFENRDVFYLLAQENDNPVALYAYSDLSEKYTVTAYYNDGTEAELTKSDFTYSSLVPNASDFESGYSAIRQGDIEVSNTFGIKTNTTMSYSNNLRPSIAQDHLQKTDPITRDFYNRFDQYTSSQSNPNNPLNATAYTGSLSISGMSDIAHYSDLYLSTENYDSKLGTNKLNGASLYKGRNIPGTNTEDIYTKSIQVSYRNGVSFTIENAAITLANPYQIFIGGVPVTNQPRGSQFNLSGLTATFIYATEYQDAESSRDTYGSGISTNILDTKNILLNLEDYKDYIYLSYNGGEYVPYGSEEAAVPEILNSVNIQFVYKGSMFFSGRILSRQANFDTVTQWICNSNEASQTYNLAFDTTGGVNQGVDYYYSAPMVDTSIGEFYEGLARPVTNVSFLNPSSSNPAVMQDAEGNRIENRGFITRIYLSNDKGQKGYQSDDGIVFDDGDTPGVRYIYYQYHHYYLNGEIVTIREVIPDTDFGASLSINSGNGSISFTAPCSILVEFELDQFEDSTVHRYWDDSNHSTIKRYHVIIRKANLDVNYAQTINGTNFTINGDTLNVSLGMLGATLPNLGVNFVTSRGIVSSATAPKNYTLHLYSNEISGLSYNGENSWIYRRRELADGSMITELNSNLNNYLLDEAGKTYFMYVTFSGNDYYYSGNTRGNQLTIKIVLQDLDTYDKTQPIERTYAREDVSAIRNVLIGQFGNDYTVDIYQNTTKLYDTTVLHVGEYTARFVKKSNSDISYDLKLLIKKVSYVDSVTAEFTGNIVYGHATAEDIEALKATARLAIPSQGVYYLFGDNTEVLYYNRNGVITTSTTDLCSVLAGENCFAIYTTQLAAGDVEGDYDLPTITVHFSVSQYELEGVSVSEDCDFIYDSLTDFYKTTYSGRNIIIQFDKSKWDDVKDYVRISVTRAMRIDDNGEELSTILSSYLYRIDQEQGTITVYGAGIYEVSVEIINTNCLWSDTATNSFVFAVEKDEFDEPEIISDFSQSAGAFVGANQYIRFVGNGETDSSGAQLKFTISSATVYQLTSRPTDATSINISYVKENGIALSAMDELRVGGIYYVVINEITSDRFWFEPLDFLGFTCAENYKAPQYMFSLTITQNVLDPLEFEDDIDRIEGESYEVVIDDAGTKLSGAIEASITLDYGTEKSILDFFVSSSVSSAKGLAYRFIFASKEGQSYGAVEIGSNSLAKTNAGEYLVIITPNTGGEDGEESYAWGPDAKNVAFSLMIRKQAVDAPNLINIMGEYTGVEQTISAGGFATYWKSLAQKGITTEVNRYALLPNTDIEILVEGDLQNTFNLEQGELKFINAGIYYISFQLPAKNYYWSDDESSAMDFTYDGDFYIRDSMKLATIAKKMIELPALNEKRVHTYNNSPVSFDFSNEIEVDNFVIEYSVSDVSSNVHVGQYQVVLTMTSALLNGTTEADLSNFGWVRNYEDGYGLLQSGGYGTLSFDANNKAIASLNYAIVESIIDIQLNSEEVFLYGGYTKDFKAITSLEAWLKEIAVCGTTEAQELLADASITLSLNGSTITNEYKNWDVKSYDVEVLMDFHGNCSNMSFDLRLVVDKLPIELIVNGTKTYGDSEEAAIWEAWEYAPNQMLQFIGVVEGSLSFVSGLDDNASADRYDLAFEINTEDSYFENYDITASGTFVVEPKILNLTLDTNGSSIYNEEMDLYSIVHLDRSGLVGEDALKDLKDLVSAKIDSTEVEDSHTVTFTIVDKNYTYPDGTPWTAPWTIEKAIVQITIQIQIYYGEEAKPGIIVSSKNTNKNVILSYDKDLTNVEITGEANYDVVNDHITYLGGFESKNYQFVDSGNSSFEYKPLELTITANSISAAYYNQKQLSYNITVSSVSSYDSSKRVALTQELLEEITGKSEAFVIENNSYAGVLWSAGAINSGSISQGIFAITTNAYTYMNPSNPNWIDDAHTTIFGMTANKGTYTILGVLGSSDNFDVQFVEATYEVLPGTFGYDITFAGEKIAENEYTLTYDDLAHTPVLISNVTQMMDTYRIRYDLGQGMDGAIPEFRNVGDYEVFYEIKSDSGNYQEVVGNVILHITKATENEIDRNWGFVDSLTNTAIVTEENDLEGATSAWVYGLYGSYTTDGFNANGNHRMLEPKFKLTANGILTYTLYSLDEDAEILESTISMEDLFVQGFRRGVFEAGEYKIIVTLAENANYVGATQNYYFKVARRLITVKPELTTVYGEEAPEFKYEYIGAVNTTGSAPDTYTITAKIHSGYEVGKPVDEYEVTLSDVTPNTTINRNYRIDIQPGKLTVTKRIVTISIASKSIEYLASIDDVAKQLDYSIITSGLPYTSYDLYYGGAEANPLNYLVPKTTINLTGTKIQNDAGEYPIYLAWTTQAVSEKENYSIYFVNCDYKAFDIDDSMAVNAVDGKVSANQAGTYTIQKKLLNVTWTQRGGSAFEYNGQPLSLFAASVIDDEVITLELQRYLGSVAEVNKVDEIKNAGEYVIVASLSEDEKYRNYTTGSSTITITITPVSIVVQIGNGSSVYGTAPDFGDIEITTSNTIPDNLAIAPLDSLLNVTFNVKDGNQAISENSHAGTYPITATYTNKNYSVTFVEGTYTIEKRVIHVALDLPQSVLSKEYDGNETRLTINQSDLASYLVIQETDWAGASNDTKSVLATAIVLDCPNAINVGNYEIVPTSTAQNYDIVFIQELNGTAYESHYRITPKALQVYLEGEVAYGDEAILNENIAYKMDGFVQGETYEQLLSSSQAMDRLGYDSQYFLVNIEGLESLSYTTNYIQGNGTGTYETLVSGLLKFLNYSVEFVEKENGIIVIPREVTPLEQSLSYRKMGYLPTDIAFQFENVYHQDVITYTAQMKDTTLSNLSDAGVYDISLTITGKDYSFKEGKETTIQVEILPLEIDAHWQQNSIVLTEEQHKVTNLLENIDQSFMNFSDITWEYIAKENADGNYETATQMVSFTQVGSSYGYILDEHSAGTYSVTITLDDARGGKNYKWMGTEDRTITISFIVSTTYFILTVETEENKVYDGNSINVTTDVNTAFKSGITTLYARLENEEQFNHLDSLSKITGADVAEYGFSFGLNTITRYDREAPLNAGYYIIYVMYYRVNEFAEEYQVFKISPKNVEQPSFSTDRDYFYTGEEQYKDVIHFGDGLDYSIDEGLSVYEISNSVITFAAKDAGTYSIHFFLENSNYIWDESDELILTWTIEKAQDQEILFPNEVTYATYGEFNSEKIPHSLKYNEGVALQYFYFACDEEGNYSQTSPVQPTNVGVYHVDILVSGKNFEDAVGSTTLVIEKRRVMVTANVSVVYGSQIQKEKVIYTFDGFINGDTEDVLARNYKAVAEINSRYGDVGNYGLQFRTEEVSLSPYALTNRKAVSIYGFYNAVSTRDNYYYVLDETNSYITVTPLSITVSIGNTSSTYGTELNMSGVILTTANQLPDEYRNLADLLGITLSVDATQESDAGEYTISATYTNGNYTVLFNNGKYTIAPREIRVEIASFGGVYRGTISSAYVTKVFAGNEELPEILDLGIFKYLYGGTSNNGEVYSSYETPFLAGSYIVTVEIDSDKTPNYILGGTIHANFVVEMLTINHENVRVDSLTYTGRELMPILIDDNYNIVTGALDTQVKDAFGNVIYTIDRSKRYIDATDYTIALTLSDAHNMRWSTGGSTYQLAFRVGKGTNSIRDLKIEGWTFGEYNAERHSPKAVLAYEADDLNIRFEYTRSGVSNWSTSIPTDAGVYYVRVVVAGSDNFEEFISGGYEFEVSKKKLSLPTLGVIAEGEGKNDTYTGSALLLSVNNYISRLMAFTFNENSKVDGDSVTITATNAGTYTLYIWIMDSTNYTWDDGANLNEDGQLELTWTIQKRAVDKPEENTNLFVVNGSVLTYFPIGFDDSIMGIRGNTTGYGGKFTVAVYLLDTDNYVWSDGTSDEITYEWEVVGVNTVFTVTVVVISVAVVVALAVGGVQLGLQLRKKKQSKTDMMNDEVEQ